ncbi:MAG TPA: O-antigen ligase family protein [Solirubrobacterales bacterium]|nr:O-antigen ligase family protein [Solirubrobacterales bacterium]
MESSSMRWGIELPGRGRGVRWDAVAVWLLVFGLVVYLGLKGGGFDPLVHDPIGIGAFWLLLIGVAIGALPRRRVEASAWTALALLAAFVVWTALSLGWTESVERTWADVARVAGYLGIFALAVFSREAAERERLIGAVAAGIAVVALIGLLSRLHPSWFPAADQTAQFLRESRERLSYPIDYWNGLAGLVAIGLPLLLHIASGARTVLLRALAAASLPALILTVYLTLSRGGIAAAALALLIYLALAPDRLPKLLTLALAGAGAAVLIAAVSARDALQHGLSNDTALQQGNHVLVLTIGVCLLVGAAQAAASLALAGDRRPGWTRFSPQQAAAAAAVLLLAALIAAAAFDAPGRASNGWDEFKSGGAGFGSGRLGSVGGENRYEFWRSALDENATRPLTGTGSGSFELWWARHATTSEPVHDTHSLYLQTLGELGIVGLVILVAFFGSVFFFGGRAALRGDPAVRPGLVAALAGAAAFCLGAAVDWTWQIPVLPLSMLLLASVLVAAPLRQSAEAPGESPAPPAMPFRVALGVVSAVAIAAVAIPLASTQLLRQSETDARAGDLAAALHSAETAQNVEPGFAGPRLQRALVLEEQGNLRPALEAVSGATARESTNWRPWLVRSRIEAELGMAAAAVRDFERARSLNPRSPIFTG